MDKIIIKGAREHNLKNIDLEIPRDKLVVITGISGSGKSSLAFDTIYAEGQRRYVESLSAYARQFLGQMEKPDVDSIEGLSPAISIDQKGASKNPRSTVGTVTEIYDYLRVLYARIGKPHCLKCKREISPQTIDQIVDRVMNLGKGTKIQILSPLVRGRKGEYTKLFSNIKKAGFLKVRIDGEIVDLSEKINLEKYKKHDIEVVVDRVVISSEEQKRITESLETSLKMGDGIVVILYQKNGKEEKIILSEKFSCPNCGINYEEISPRMFSFNSPYGACPECNGLGSKMEIDPDLIIFDKEKSIRERGILPWGITSSNFYHQLVKAVAEDYGIDIDTPVKKLPKEFLKYLLYGDDNSEHYITVHFRNRVGEPRVVHLYFQGLVTHLSQKYRETESDFLRSEIEKYMSIRPCPECKGARLKPESLAVTIGGKSIAEVCALSIEKCKEFFENLELTEKEKLIAHQILKEIKERLNFLINVGLDYLTLDRPTSTLAGGEAQRIRLATQVGSGLMGVVYILDEPSVGLHQRDNQRLIDTLKKLRNLGNTVIVVEHDESTIRAADYIIDLGPGAGLKGGRVVAKGTLQDIMNSTESITGKYLKGELSIPIPKERRKLKNKFLIVKGARQFNLKNITVKIPLGTFVCITGVSGSGKSTLVEEIIYKALSHYLHGSMEKAGEYDEIIGIENIDKVIQIDQSPIGRTPRSNPATYTKTFDLIRELFSQVPEARMRGYKPGRFSFNVKGGRCESCSGDGMIKIEMHFLPDVYVTCEVCKGKRYNRETLQIYYKGKNIYDVLEMTVEEALDFFSNIPKIKTKLQTLQDVGLGYIKLGQPATTLSGGEAQRVKLAAELSRPDTGNTLYILDEPTTGLHFDDINKLLQVLHRLTDLGNTVLVIEHNLDVIKTADYIIDLGPEGGERGGYIIAEGTPEEIVKNENSYTGKFLKRLLK
jgi:excinuclease ABC subunit A